jgi:lipoate-protein ligase A
VDHTSFTAAVVNEFRKEYGINDEVCFQLHRMLGIGPQGMCAQATEIEETDDLLSVNYIKKGMSELPVSL